MKIHGQGKRQGFQLIELLLVIAILAVLIGLIVPAVMKQRIAGREPMRINNLRQLVIAAHNCHDTYRKFPPHWGYYPGTVPNPKMVAEATRRSLQFHILPYIDGAPLYNAGITTAAFDPYVCPLDPTIGDGTDGAGRGVTSYLCNTLAFPVTYSRMPGSFTSGTSNVVFFVTATAEGQTPDGGRWHYWGGHPDQTVGVAHFVGNQPLPPLPLTANVGPYQRGAQLTPGGSQVAMGDASTRSVHPHILAALWQAVTNPANPTEIPNDWNQ